MSRELSEMATSHSRQHHECNKWVDEAQRLQSELAILQSAQKESLLVEYRHEIKVLQQRARRLVQRETQVIESINTQKSDLETLRNNIRNEAMTAREAVSLKRKFKRLQLDLEKKKRANQRVQGKFDKLKESKSETSSAVVLSKLRERCIYFENKSAQFQEERDQEKLLRIDIENELKMPEQVCQLIDRGKRQPFPVRFVALAMRQMGNGTPASRVAANVLPVLKYAQPKAKWTMHHMPGQTTLKEWRLVALRYSHSYALEH